MDRANCKTLILAQIRVFFARYGFFPNRLCAVAYDRFGKNQSGFETIKFGLKRYAFRGCIPRKSGVGAADFVLNNDPIAAGAIGEECSTKDVVLTSALPGIDPLNAYLKSEFCNCLGNFPLFLVSLSLFVVVSLSTFLIGSLPHERMQVYEVASPIALLIAFLVLFFLGRKRKGGRALTTVFFFSTLACGTQLFFPTVLKEPLRYFLSHVFSVVPAVAVWGWALERYRFKEGALHLSLFVVVMLLAPIPLSLLQLKKEMVIYGILFGLQLIALILSVVGRGFHLEEGETPPPPKRMRLGLILLFFAFPFAKVFPDLFFRLHMQEAFSAPYEYSKALAAIILLKGKMTYLMGFVGVVFGLLFFLTGKRLWALVTGSALVVVGAAGVLICFPIETLGKTFYKYDYAVYGGFSSLFLYPLAQLVFFSFPKGDRFSLKLFAGLIISKAGTLFGGLSLSGIHILMGSISLGTLFYIALFLLGIISGFAGIHLLKPKDVS